MTGETSTHDTKLVEKNDTLILIPPIFLPRPQYDRTGSFTTFLPIELTDEAMKMLSFHTSTSGQVSQLGFVLAVLTDQVAQKSF